LLEPNVLGNKKSWKRKVGGTKVPGNESSFPIGTFLLGNERSYAQKVRVPLGLLRRVGSVIILWQ